MKRLVNVVSTGGWVGILGLMCVGASLVGGGLGSLVRAEEPATLVKQATFGPGALSRSMPMDEAMALPVTWHKTKAPGVWVGQTADGVWCEATAIGDGRALVSTEHPDSWTCNEDGNVYDATGALQVGWLPDADCDTFFHAATGAALFGSHAP
jgi:hypothetical protein